MAQPPQYHKLRLDDDLFYWNINRDWYATLEDLHRPDFKPRIRARLSYITILGDGWAGCETFRVIYDPFTENIQFRPTQCKHLTSCPPGTLNKIKSCEKIRVWKPHSVSWSPNGKFLAVSHTPSPHVTIYQRNGNTFNKSTAIGSI